MEMGDKGDDIVFPVSLKRGMLVRDYAQAQYMERVTLLLSVEKRVFSK